MSQRGVFVLTDKTTRLLVSGPIRPLHSGFNVLTVINSYRGLSNIEDLIGTH